MNKDDFQVANFRRQLDARPVATDFLIYFDVETKH